MQTPMGQPEAISFQGKMPEKVISAKKTVLKTKVEKYDQEHRGTVGTPTVENPRMRCRLARVHISNPGGYNTNRIIPWENKIDAGLFIPFLDR